MDRSTLTTARGKRNQSDIADELGVTQATVSNWETGESTPHPSQWKRIAEVYGVSMNKLFEMFGARAS